MNQNDYVILFDENGTPYIAHGILDSAKSAVSNATKGIGRGVRENHKYILKILENGKNRYFYTQDEVNAYYQAKRMGIKNAAEYAQNTFKNTTTAVNNAARSAVGKAKDSANNTVSNAKNRFERMKSEFRDKAEQAGNVAKSAASKAADALNPVSVNYANEPESNKRKLLNVTYSSREAEQEMKDELKKKAAMAVARPVVGATRAAINAARTVAGTVKDTAKDLAGADERAFRDAMRKKIDDQRANNEDVSDADIASAQDAQRIYSRTPLGMIENAKKVIPSAKDTATAITQATANKLRAKYESGKALTKEEMNQLFAYIFKNSK